MSKLAQAIAENVRQALSEDQGSGDLTATLVDGNSKGHARVISRERAVLCGCDWFSECFSALDPGIQIIWMVKEGDWVNPDQNVCEIFGKARSMLTGERSALNFLQLLSATATITRRYVEAIKHTKANIYDTRKTIPGLRVAQKYAVHVGGGLNHRMGLYDGILIKENHIAAAGSIRAALERAEKVKNNASFVQIEVETLDQLQEALEAGAEMILLDNMTLEQVREAVRINAGHAKLEVSGNILFDELVALAETGVDRISIGALTKNLKAIDFSMRFDSL